MPKAIPPPLSHNHAHYCNQFDHMNSHYHTGQELYHTRVE
jgi:hypothetical protein